MVAVLVLSGWRRRRRYGLGIDCTASGSMAHVLRLLWLVERPGIISSGGDVVLRKQVLMPRRHPILNSDLVAALRAEKFEGVRVLRMSGSSVLLIFNNIENRWQVKERDVLSTWFDRVSKLCEDDSSFENRRVWVSVFGVLIHAWTSETFERVVAHSGGR
ncbi:hypothetical protein V6N13_016750 [Hibiscus sabdariffa]